MEGLTWGHDLNRISWTLPLLSCHVPSPDPCLLYQDQWNSSVPATHYNLLDFFADSHVDPPSEHFFPSSPVCQFLLTFITQFIPNFIQEKNTGAQERSVTSSMFPYLCNFNPSPCKSLVIFSSAVCLPLILQFRVTKLDRASESPATPLAKKFWLSRSDVRPQNLHPYQGLRWCWHW